MRIDLGDIRLAYDDTGAGDSVLLLHGFPHQRALWSEQRQGLSGRWRIITPDLRGFGESEAKPPYSVEQYADDVARLLDALQIDHAVIGGLSMGGYVTFAFWRRHRERVRALIFADTRAGADDEVARARRRELIVLAQERGSGAVADAMMEGMVGKTTRLHRPEIVEAMRAMLAAAPVEGVIGGLEAMLTRPDSTPTLATIDVSTLVIVGSEDALTRSTEAQAIQRGVLGSVLRKIPRAGHLSCAERPAAFNHVTSEFLEALPPLPEK